MGRDNKCHEITSAIWSKALLTCGRIAAESFSHFIKIVIENIVFRPLSLFIGLRYTRAKRRNHFISFMALSSMLGIALGVMVLITVLSVMNGFDFEIRHRIFEMASQVAVRTLSNPMNNWEKFAVKLEKNPEVIASAPFVEGQGMLTHVGIVHPVMITGIDPIRQKSVSKIASKMVEGRLSDLKAKQFGIILGQDLANHLGLIMGDKVTLITPEADLSPVGVNPRFKRFKVVGIFSAGNGFGFDSQLGFINIHDAQTLYRLGKGVTGIRLRIKELYQAPQLSRELAKGLSANFYVTNWTQRYGPLFKAINLEKNMMFLILILIIAVAAFNLVSSLVMVVSDKRARYIL